MKERDPIKDKLIAAKLATGKKLTKAELGAFVRSSKETMARAKVAFMEQGNLNRAGYIMLIDSPFSKERNFMRSAVQTKTWRSSGGEAELPVITGALAPAKTPGIKLTPHFRATLLPKEEDACSLAPTKKPWPRQHHRPRLHLVEMNSTKTPQSSWFFQV